MANHSISPENKGQEGTFFYNEKSEFGGAVVKQSPVVETGSSRYSGFSLAEL